MYFAAPKEKAHLAPFAAFFAFLVLTGLLEKVFEGVAKPWWMAEPRFWIFPLQTLVCGWLLVRGWEQYDWRAPTRPVLATAVGIAVLSIWIAPQAWLGFPARRDGFDPTLLGPSGWVFQVTVALRFLRLAVVVPLLEEIFWRGFLLRYLIREPFSSVPFGTWSPLSFAVVTIGFCLEHQPADWPAAAIAGALYNFVAYRTGSLSACVLAHAVTNLGLGMFVMRTGQWGFW
ncbi:MAG: protease family protein [Chthoniobacter sp.]|jgi:CAAX prenyl protease-like protein|nr:protease family protein [Chthoniobacter sp.]